MQLYMKDKQFIQMMTIRQLTRRHETISIFFPQVHKT